MHKASRVSASTSSPAVAPRAERYVSLSVAAEYFSVSEKTLRRYIADRKIPARRLGRQVRVKISEIESAMDLMGSAA
jgi:excisionase family DNA binding protein